MKNQFNVGSIKQFIDISGLNESDEVIRKQYVSEIKLNPDSEKTIIARISSTATDADGDVIDPEGCDFKRFMANGVIHKNHDYRVESVIGKALEVSTDAKGIVAKIKFADTEAANDVWKLVRDGYVKANSIGFIIRDYVIKGTKEFTDYIKSKGMIVDDACRRIIKNFELIESSIVSVPCNPEALNQAISAKSIELSEQTIKELAMFTKVEPKEEVIEPVVNKESKEEIVDLLVKMDDALQAAKQLEIDLDKEYGEVYDTAKPYPSEHAARQTEPSKYKAFRRKNDAGGPGIDFIYGIYEEDGKTKSEVQTIRFDASRYTVTEAKKWLADHNFKTVIEPAANTARIWRIIREGEPKIDKEMIKSRIKGKIV